MTVSEFAQKIVQLAALVPMSVTSWGRTWKRNQDVGGHPFSYHLTWLAVDVQLERETDLELLEGSAGRLGLDVISEKDHVHIEPRG